MKMKKKIITVACSMVMIAAMLSGCGQRENTSEGNTSEGKANTEGEAADIKYTIGISQFAEHGSLDNCRKGFLAGLAEEGIVEGENLTVVFDNAQADTGTASTIAESFVSQHVDMICAIATPSAMSAYNSSMETDIPVVYTAVSDPVGAGLAMEDNSSVGNVTGSSDILPVSAQLEMIRTMLPNAEKIGIIYTTSEANSISTIETYKELSGEYGFEIVEQGISSAQEVEMAAADLVGKVDCISNLTDNTVVSALQTVLALAADKNIPVFGSEIEQVKAGCIASMGIEYFELGRQTGEMAAKILKGETTAKETPYITAQEAELYVNKAAAQKISLELDESYISGAAEAFDEIIVE